MQLTQRRAFAAGWALLALAAALGAAHLALPGRIRGALRAAVLAEVRWAPGAPPRVRARYEGGDPAEPPLLVRFYLWNVTNVATVRKGGRPALQEVGPFTYCLQRRRVDVRFSPDNGTASFLEWIYFVPEPQPGDARLDEEVTTLNVPLVGVLEALAARAPARAAPWLALLARVVEGFRDARVHGLFVTRRAEELLWGYEDPLLKRLAQVLPKLGVDVAIPRVFALAHNMTTPEDGGQFAGRDAVGTGAGADDLNASQLMDYREWRGAEEVTSWAPPHVERVRGSDGSQFPPFLEEGAAVEVWAGETFRAARLLEGYGPLGLPAKNIKAGGVPVLRFRPDPAAADVDPRYFQAVRGLLNVTAPFAAGPAGAAAVAAGPPLFLSLPGYCFCDEALAAELDGIACEPERHDMYLDVEPTTGITLRAQKGIMLSSWFGERYGAVDPGVQDTFLPIFWAQQRGGADAAALARFAPIVWARRAAAALERGAPAAAGAGGALGAALLLGAALVPVRRVWEEEDEEGGRGAPLLGEPVAGGGPGADEEGLTTGAAAPPLCEVSPAGGEEP
jgi:hypothetical protein